jgi:hypothetical protein
MCVGKYGCTYTCKINRCDCTVTSRCNSPTQWVPLAGRRPAITQTRHVHLNTGILSVDAARRPQGNCTMCRHRINHRQIDWNWCSVDAQSCQDFICVMFRYVLGLVIQLDVWWSFIGALKLKEDLKNVNKNFFSYQNRKFSTFLIKTDLRSLKFNAWHRKWAKCVTKSDWNVFHGT